MKIDWGKLELYDTIASKLDLQVKNNKTFIFSYDLNTPSWKDEETFKIKGVYDNKNPDFYIIQ